MIRRKQLFKHDPENGTFGDCHRTAIACLLNMEPEQVPHFGEHFLDAKKFNEAERAFLASRGMAKVNVAFDCPLEALLTVQKTMNPNAYYLLGCQSVRGIDHTVVCCGGEVICDPSTGESGADLINGPVSDGYYWVTFLTPLSLHREMYE
jgi:hypothetical protein